jgi:NADH-quinone oxidoreductase subunit F
MERPLTQNIRQDRVPLSVNEYKTTGGYKSLLMTLREMTPGEVKEEVNKSTLKGRGGAGFPTGLKWSFFPEIEKIGKPRYLVANADEMEPGTFKDRLLLEGNPHQIIEGILITAYALQADVSYIYLRWEYRQAYERIKLALKEAYEQNLIGSNILGSKFDHNIFIHVSAGRYMCGEETALLNALEGKRASPRAKPPFPQVSGLWGRPTIVQNVETLCNVPWIVLNGAEWFRNLSKIPEGGTKLFGVSGRVKIPGLWELLMGTLLREIVEQYAGGMREGLKLRAVMPGGSSTSLLLKEHLSAQMGFDTMIQAGSRLGTGTVIVLDDKTCPVGLLENLIHFYARESCGWCTPCREGLAWINAILYSIENGAGKTEDIEILNDQCELLASGNTYCALAPGAIDPLKSALKYFAEDFEIHIMEKRCPYDRNIY